MTKRESKINRAAFAETPRDAVNARDLESAVEQVLRHPARPVSKSENREPSKEEMGQRWKMVRED